MKKELILEILGWLGVLLFLVAYFLVSFQIAASDSLVYQGMNLVGSIFVIADLFRKKAFYMVVLEVFWGAIALISLLKIYL